MVKTVSFALALSIAFMVASVNVLAEVPDGALPIESVNHFIWYLNSQTGYNATMLSQYSQVKSNSLTVDDLLTTNYVWAYPFGDMKLADGTRVTFEKGNTYHLTLTYANGQRMGWSTASNFPARLLMSGSQHIQYSVPVTDYSNDNTYSCTVVDSSGYTTVDIVFHITTDLPGTYYYIAPFIRFTGGTELIISQFKINGYIDPDLNIFESLMAEKLDAILGIIQSNGEQNHEDLENILNELEDGGEGDSYDKGVEDAVGDLSASEGEVNSLISNKVIVVDGNTSIVVDGNVYARLDAYVNNLPNAESYDVHVGILINRVFNEFASYLAVVMVLSLSVGLGVTWLSNKEVSR